MRAGSKAGLTMPEMVIACMILGLSMSAMVTGFVMCQKTVAYSNNNVLATHEARRVLEGLTSSSYSDASLSVGTHNLSNGYYIVSENAGSKDVAVTIRWTNPTRITNSSSVTLTTSMSYAIHR